MKKSDLEIKYEKKIKSLSKKEIDTLDAIFPVKWYTYMNKGVFKSKNFKQDPNKDRAIYYIHKILAVKLIDDGLHIRFKGVILDVI